MAETLMKRARQPVFDRARGCWRCWLLLPLDETRTCEHCRRVVELDQKIVMLDEQFDRIFGEE